MMIKRKTAILSLMLAATLILSSCTSPYSATSPRSNLSFDLYKEKYAKNILNLIECKSTKDGIIGYSNTETDINSTYYALKILEILGSDGIPLKASVIENKIIDTLSLLDESQDLSDLDALWYLVNINILINVSSSPETDLNVKIINSLKRYVENDFVYEDDANLYRISMMQEILGVSLLNKQKVTAFVNSKSSDINETTILSTYTVLYIAKANGIDINSNVLKHIFDIADKRINEMYSDETTAFPDLYELFQLLCYIDPNYQFNSDALIKTINRFEFPSGLYGIAQLEKENLLPTYWGILIHNKIGLGVDKKDEIISRVKQSQNLDGLFNFISETNIDPNESYAAKAIYKMLDGNMQMQNTFGEITEISPRGRYCYAFSAEEYNSPKQIDEFVLKIQSVLKNYVVDLRFSNLYMSYFQLALLNDLEQPIEKDITENLLKNLDTLDVGDFDEIGKFLFLAIENLIRKEIDTDYLISEDAKAAVSNFMNSQNNIDNVFKNDTLTCLYMCIKLIEDDSVLLEEHRVISLQILDALLLDDGLFCNGVANEEAGYDSTFMGLEILDILS